MKLDRKQLGIHLPWGLITTIVVVGLGSWYGISSIGQGRWLGGGSLAGLACGTAAGLVIAFEMLLWPRKYFRRLRLIPARHWMAAHIWLGIASMPLAILHSGFHLGGTLPTVFLLFFALTILSGIYGLVMQHVIPKLMLRSVPAETIYSQIDHVSELGIQHLRQAITAACGSRDKDDDIYDNEPALPEQSMIVVGAIREIGLVRGKTLETKLVVRNPADRSVLWTAFDELAPFLAHGKRAKSAFVSPAYTSRWFSDLRRACTEESEIVIASMHEYFVQRQQFDFQRSLHHWLHAWLPIHIGLSVAVTVLLVVHIFTALMYW